jgi:UDP-glucuronate decarboxylase
MKHRKQQILTRDIEQIVEKDLGWATFSGQRIVVTGASGFIGGYLTRTLLALNARPEFNLPVKVVGVVRNLEYARTKLDDVITDANLELLEWDLTRIAIPTLGECDYILHAASLASPKFYVNQPASTLLPNTVGTASLLEAFRTQSSSPKGFLFVSSSEVYGLTSQEILPEDAFGVIDPATLRSCYAESKRLGETICVSWHKQFSMPTYIVRPFHTYGPGLQENDGRVFADFVFDIVRGQDIKMKSDGSARRAFCYVTDAIIGFFTVLLKGEIATPYNVANPAAELSVRNLADLLVSLFPEKCLRVVPCSEKNDDYVASTFSKLIPDVSRLVSLGWAPTVDPITGFRRMIEASSI